MRSRPPAEVFGYESAEPSESWMTVLQHHGVFGADAVPPPLVSYFHRPPTENGTSSQKSKHDSARAITVATTPSADPTADDAVRDREVVGQKVRAARAHPSVTK